MEARAQELGERLAAIRERLAAAASAAGRDPDEVTLVAVSKTRPADDVRAAYAAGQRDFGENYAQELAAKRTALADLPELRWHFIGALQSNKARLVVPGTTLVHAIDRLSVGDALGRRACAAGTIADVLVEVNIGEEATKGGIRPRDADVLCAALSGIAGLRVRGLMCIPPACDDVAVQRAAFRRLRELRDAVRAQLPSVELLSMGMSSDFEAAIAEGATHVRVGTAIFGARDPA